MQIRTHGAPALLAALVSLASACNDSNERGGAPPGDGETAELLVLVTDAPGDQLSSFSAVLASVRLAPTTGRLSPNLLSEPARIEFRGLEDLFEWVASGEVAAREYAALVLEFLPGSYRARELDGRPVSIVAESDVWIAPFDAPLSLAADERAVVAADLDLTASLASIGALALELVPTGPAMRQAGLLPIDEVRGVPTSVTGAVLQLQAFDDELEAPRGTIAVELSGALLLDEEGDPFGDSPTAVAELQGPGGDPAAEEQALARFRRAIEPGRTVVEVHGNLAPGPRLVAERVEIEAQELSSSGLDAVQVEGRVTDLTPSGFTLAVQEVEAGAEIVPLLLPPGELDPSELEIAVDDRALFLFQDSIVSAAALSPGHFVEVEIAPATTGVLLAREVELATREPVTVGRIAAVTEEGFLLVPDPGEPAVTSGLLFPGAEILVVTSGASIELDTAGRPELAAAELRVGLGARVVGEILGAGGAAFLEAERVKARSGKLRGAIAAEVELDPFGVPELRTYGGVVLDPFGRDAQLASEEIGPSGPMIFPLDPATVVRGAADSPEELAALFLSLPEGLALRVDVAGIGTGEPYEARAFEVFVTPIP